MNWWPFIIVAVETVASIGGAYMTWTDRSSKVGCLYMIFVLFASIVCLSAWFEIYNHFAPHTSLDYHTVDGYSLAPVFFAPFALILIAVPLAKKPHPKRPRNE
jgi:hypothetical protein